MDYEKFGNVIKCTIINNENKLIIDFENNNFIELLIKTNIKNSCIIIYWPNDDNVCNNINNIINKKINSIKFINITRKDCYGIFLNFDIILGDNLVKIPVFVKYDKAEFDIQYPNKKFDIEMFYEIKTQSQNEEKLQQQSQQLQQSQQQSQNEEQIKKQLEQSQQLQQSKQLEQSKQSQQLEQSKQLEQSQQSQQSQQLKKQKQIPKLERKYINYKYTHNSLEFGIGLGIGFGIGVGILLLSHFFTK
jgi:hypothetical protein